MSHSLLLQRTIYAKLVTATRLLVQEDAEEPVTLLLNYVGDYGFQQQASETEHANDVLNG